MLKFMQMCVDIKKHISLLGIEVVGKIFFLSFALPLLINHAHTYVSVAGPSSNFIYYK